MASSTSHRPDHSNMSQIQQFYVGQNIFITGVTGFLGKVLLEKLLRSCPDIGTIYVLIRAKKGKSPEERINALIDDPVFSVLRSDYPEFTKKIVGVIGDTAKERLGLSATDYARLVNEVSVIFHLAATVRFDEKLETAIAINVNSVKYVIDLGRECTNLKAAIHVSTAYSHCVRKSISERMQPPPLSYDEISKLIGNARENKKSEDEEKVFEQSLLGEWPNTYSFTKAVAEGVVAEFAGDLPFAVFRPSIVTSTYTEPVPGWVGGPIGIPGLICAGGLGILHIGQMDQEATVDLVPADYVCNALISSAWEIGVSRRRHDEEVPVYNYVSGTRNPITWRGLFDRVVDFGRIYPSNLAVYYPSGFRSKSDLIFTVLHFLLHAIPALLVDTIAKLFGRNLGLYKMACKFGKTWPMLRYFTTQQWKFEDTRFSNLWNQMGLLDKRMFPFNIQSVDWDEHTMKMIRGLRRYLLHESDENLKQARRRHFYLFLVHMILMALFIFSVLWMIWVLFGGPNLAVGIQFLRA